MHRRWTMHRPLNSSSSTMSFIVVDNVKKAMHDGTHCRRRCKHIVETHRIVVLHPPYRVLFFDYSQFQFEIGLIYLFIFIFNLEFHFPFIHYQRCRGPPRTMGIVHFHKVFKGFRPIGQVLMVLVRSSF